MKFPSMGPHKSRDVRNMLSEHNLIRQQNIIATELLFLAITNTRLANNYSCLMAKKAAGGAAARLGHPLGHEPRTIHNQLFKLEHSHQMGYVFKFLISKEHQSKGGTDNQIMDQRTRNYQCADPNY